MPEHNVFGGSGTGVAADRSIAIDRRGFLRFAGSVVGGVSVLGLGACGGAESGDGGSTSGGGYQGKQAVAHLDSIAAAAPFIIAEQEGYFSQEKLKLESVSFPGGADVVRAIQSTMHFGMPATLPTLIAYAKGVETLRIVSGFFNTAGVVYIVPADSPIKSKDDLAGKKIGVSEPSSITTYFGNLLKESVKGTPVEIVSVGGPPDAKTALDQGLVDVAWSSPPFSTALTGSGKYRAVVSAGDLKPAWADNTLVVTEPFIESNREVVRSWLAALGKAIDLIHSDPDRAAAAWGKRVELEPKVLKSALTDYRDAYTLEIDREGIQANVEAGQAMGQLKEPPPLDVIIVDDLVPSS